MQLNIEKPFVGLVDKVIQYAGAQNPGALAAMGGGVLSMGRETSPGFGVDASAMNPGFVMDSNLIKGTRGKTAEIDALMKAEPGRVKINYTFDSARGGFVLDFSKSAYVRDAIGPILTGSALAPNAIAYFKEVFMQPMAWSNARRLVSIENGTDPWAEVMQMVVASYVGNGIINTSGSPDNTMTKDVEVQSGVLAQPVINVEASWKLSFAEMKRAETAGGFPFAGQLINEKPAFAKWLVDLLTDVSVYFGNTPSGTLGIFNVASIVDWTTINSNTTMAALNANGGNTNKGSTAYQWLATEVVSILTALQNKAKKVVIGMAPNPYNLLGKMPYSDIYNPASALKIFTENFMSGAGIEGGAPTFEIYPDPLLAANTPFNPTSHDRMVIAVPELGTGVADKSQKLLTFGMPLDLLMYPQVPQGYSQQSKIIRRISGVFAPLNSCVKVYSTFGV